MRVIILGLLLTCCFSAVADSEAKALFDPPASCSDGCWDAFNRTCTKVFKCNKNNMCITPGTAFYEGHEDCIAFQKIKDEDKRKRCEAAPVGSDLRRKCISGHIVVLER